jgi:hypothetical protein
MKFVLKQSFLQNTQAQEVSASNFESVCRSWQQMGDQFIAKLLFDEGLMHSYRQPHLCKRTRKGGFGWKPRAQRVATDAP